MQSLPGNFRGSVSVANISARWKVAGDISQQMRQVDQRSGASPLLISFVPISFGGVTEERNSTEQMSGAQVH